MSTTLPEQTETPSAVIVERVRSRIDDLRKTTTTATWQRVRDETTGQLVRRAAMVQHPPLVLQLARSVAGSTGGVGSSGSKARPPGSLEGLDALRTITREAAYLAGRTLATMAAAAVPGLRVRVQPRTLADALEVLHRYAGDLDRDSLLDLDAAVRRWWARARVVTTWDAPPLKPYVPCPACGVRGRLQVVDAPLAMVCLECHEAWDGLTIGELEAIYRLAFAEPIPDPTPADTPPVDASLHVEHAGA